MTVAYGTDGLRTGAAGLRGVAGPTDASSRALQSAPLDAVMFGRPGVRRPSPRRWPPARRRRAASSSRVSARAALAGRADVTAELGDGLHHGYRRRGPLGHPRRSRRPPR